MTESNLSSTLRFGGDSRPCVREPPGLCVRLPQPLSARSRIIEELGRLDKSVGRLPLLLRSVAGEDDRQRIDQCFSDPLDDQSGFRDLAGRGFGKQDAIGLPGL